LTKQCLPLPRSSGYHSNSNHTATTSNINLLSTPTLTLTPKLLAGRLDAIRTQLLEGGHFKYVEMNAQKDKLILRSYTRAKEPAVKAEAFVYMEFEDGTDRVHAALACEDAAFKKQISTALKGLKDV